MTAWGGALQRRMEMGEPVHVGNIRLTPQAYSWVWRGQGMGLGGMIIWRRPHSVRVEQDGRSYHLPIPDVTRRVQWICWGVAALCVWIALLRPFQSLKP